MSKRRHHVITHFIVGDIEIEISKVLKIRKPLPT